MGQKKTPFMFRLKDVKEILRVLTFDEAAHMTVNVLLINGF